MTGITAIPTGGGWHHAAVTYDTATDTWNLYLDGVLERDARPAGGNFTPESTSIQHAALGTALNSTGVASRLLRRRARRGPDLERRAHRCPDPGQPRTQELTSGTGLVARFGLNEGAGTSVASSVAGASHRHRRRWPAVGPAAHRSAAASPVFSTEFTDRTDAEGAVISFDANATDANPGDTLTYSATNLPDGISINSSTGVVSGTLSATSVRQHAAVVLTVSDGTLTDTDSFTWTVTEPAANVAPVFSTEFTDRTDDEGAVISGFDANATDANPGDTLTYSATNLPDGISINSSTGVVSGTLSATSSGATRSS